MKLPVAVIDGWDIKVIALLTGKAAHNPQTYSDV